MNSVQCHIEHVIYEAEVTVQHQIIIIYIFKVFYEEILCIFIVCLTAKRVQLKRQCHELAEDLEAARINWDKLTQDLKEAETEIDLEMYVLN